MHDVYLLFGAFGFGMILNRQAADISVMSYFF